MVQEFMVLRCYSCQTFQVHQVKKILKWNCKVCGEKQSQKKVYGQGKASDCRKHVQKLNMFQGDIQNNQHTVVEDGDDDDDDDVNHRLSSNGAGDIENFATAHQDLVNGDECLTPVGSKWNKFMMAKCPDSVQFEDNKSGEFQLTTERVLFDKATCKRKRREKDETAKNPGKPKGKAAKRQFMRFEQRQEDIIETSSTDPRKNHNLIDKVGAQEKDADTGNHDDCLRSQQTSFTLTRSGVNAAISINNSKRDSSLSSRHSKWSKFLAPSSDENALEHNSIFITPGDTSPECLQNFSIGSHQGSDNPMPKCLTKEIPGSDTRVKSAKFASVFSISDDLEEGGWDI